LDGYRLKLIIPSTGVILSEVVSTTHVLSSGIAGTMAAKTLRIR
jgi:phosphate/sulfate permease